MSKGGPLVKRKRFWNQFIGINAKKKYWSKLTLKLEVNCHWKKKRKNHEEIENINHSALKQIVFSTSTRVSISVYIYIYKYFNANISFFSFFSQIFIFIIITILSSCSWGWCGTWRSSWQQCPAAPAARSLLTDWGRPTCQHRSPDMMR